MGEGNTGDRLDRRRQVPAIAEAPFVVAPSGAFIDLPLHLGRDGFTPSTRKCQTMDGVKPSLP